MCSRVGEIRCGSGAEAADAAEVSAAAVQMHYVFYRVVALKPRGDWEKEILDHRSQIILSFTTIGKMSGDNKSLFLYLDKEKSMFGLFCFLEEQ